MLTDEQRIEFAYDIVHVGSNGEGLNRTYPTEYLLLKWAAFLVKRCNGAYSQYSPALEEIPLAQAVRELLFLPKIGFVDYDANAARRTGEQLVREGYLRLKDGRYGTVEGAEHEGIIRDLAALADTIHWTAQNHDALNAPWVDCKKLFDLIAHHAPRGRSLDVAHALQAMVRDEVVDEALKDAVTTIFVQISTLCPTSH